jgi:hypothetical protein
MTNPYHHLDTLRPQERQRTLHKMFELSPRSAVYAIYEAGVTRDNALVAILPDGWGIQVDDVHGYALLDPQRVAAFPDLRHP